MTWYYVVATIVAILVGATGIIIALVKAVWVLSGMFGGLNMSIVEMKIGQAETQKDVTAITAKIESMQAIQNSLQARTIRLEEKVDKLGQ